MGLFDFLKKKEFEEINKLKSQLEQFKSILDIEAEVANQKNNLEKLIVSKNAEVKSIEDNINTLNTNYQKALDTYRSYAEKFLYVKAAGINSKKPWKQPVILPIC